MDGPRLLTSKEASQILRIPLSTLYRLCKQARIRSIRLGKQYRFKKEDIIRYFNYGIAFDKPTLLERRQYSRINCNIPAKFNIAIPDIKDTDYQGIIKNISASGALLSIKDKEIPKIDIQDTITLSFIFVLNYENMFIQSKARIARVCEDGLGIRFEGIQNDLRERLFDYAGE